MAEKTKNKRIRGEDCGDLTPGFILTLNRLLKEDPKRAEVYLYIEIFKRNFVYHQCFREWATSPRHDQLLIRMNEDYEYSLFYLIHRLEPFGVTLVYAKDNETISTWNSESFRKWSKFWHDHIERFDSDTLEEFQDAVYDCRKDLTPYLPAREWNEE